MPRTRVSLLKGKPPEYQRAILDGLYQAMREVFDVSDDDRFMMIDEYDKSNFLFGENYLGIARNMRERKANIFFCGVWAIPRRAGVRPRGRG